MAGLTTAARTTAPYDKARRRVGCKVYTFSGAGADATEIVAAAAGSVHQIMGGYVSTDGGAAEQLAILSDATGIGGIYLPAAESTILLPWGIYTEPGEALKFDKSGAVATITGEVWVATIGEGKDVPVLP